MKKLSLLAILIQLFFFSSKAQVGINILNPDSSAILQLESNSKGLGLPRLNTTQRDSISNPLNGLTIFNTQDSLIEYWNGACWLKAYQRNCTECEFTMSLSSTSDTLDPTISDSASTSVTLAHTNGIQPISLIYLSSLPPGVTINVIGPSNIDSSATVQVVVTVGRCVNVGGNFPIILEAFCGDEILFTTFSLYIRPPVQIVIPTDVTDYNLQTMNGLPSTPAQYVLLNVNAGVTLHASTPATPAYTSGSIDPNSLVCITNQGSILGRGGDGAGLTLGGFTVGGLAGKAGGDAMHLTSQTVLVNLGTVYAGGSGGGSIGLAYSTPSIPVIGSITIGLVFCGGGGSELGAGGAVNQNGINLGIFDPGTAATCCFNSTPGVGATRNIPLSFSVSVASITLTPHGAGGNGGAFAQQGSAGTAGIDLSVSVFGFTVLNVHNVLSGNGPASGAPGVAIKRNSHTLFGGITDGSYNSSQLKGAVEP